MKINDEDRALAKEIIDAFGIENTRLAEKMLAITLAAHRQRPADEKPTSGSLVCDAVHPSNVRITCARSLGHDGQHLAADRTSWSDEDPTLCGAVYDNGNPNALPVRCARRSGHEGPHKAHSPTGLISYGDS